MKGDDYERVVGGRDHPGGGDPGGHSDRGV